MRNRSSFLLALAVSLALPSAMQAQGRDVYKLPTVTPEIVGSIMGRSQPGISGSAPLGFGPSQGDIFAGFGFVTKAAGTNKADGSLSVGGGFLDPYRTVGVEAVLTSLSTIRGGFGQRMAMGAKVHRVVRGWGVGLGVENVLLTGDSDADPSVYLAATRTFNVRREAEFFRSGSINVGLGNGRFQSPEALADGESGIGIFVSSSIRVNTWSSAVIDYTGSQVNLALSLAPFRTLPIIITPVMSDITGEAGSAGRLSLGAGMSWKY